MARGSSRAASSLFDDVPAITRKRFISGGGSAAGIDLGVEAADGAPSTLGDLGGESPLDNLMEVKS